MDLNLSSSFVQTISTGFGEQGQKWLNALPNLINHCEKRYSMIVQPPFPDLSYNFVAPAVLKDGKEIILKLGVPRQELLSEAEALRTYNGRGSARLIGGEPQEGILLLERLRPGRMLVELWPEQDEKATRIATQVMIDLWRPASEKHTLLTVQDWFEGFGRLRKQFGGGSGPFPARLVDKGQGLYTELQHSMSSPLVLHGDLHHFNILSAQRAPWLAIDPKGIVGEKAYDTGALLRNPLPEMYKYPKVFERRVAILAEMLDSDRQRIQGWALAQAVLSAWWSFEDHGAGWEEAIALGEMIMKQSV